MDVEVNLNFVKHESLVTNVCYSCLSQDRVLSPLYGHVDLFIHLLGEQGSSMELDRVLICWECTAILRRMSRFQWQVQSAQIVLQNMLAQDMSPNPLSNLKINKLESFDSTGPIESETELQTETIHPCYEVKLTDVETKTTTMVKDEQPTDDKEFILKQSDDDTDYEIYFEEPNIGTAPKLKIKTELQTKTAKLNKKRSKQFIKYHKTAKRTKNPDVDLKDFYSCFTTALTESDIENIGKDIAHKRKLEKYSKLACLQCRQVFKSAVIMRKHKTFCHILKGESPGPFTCLECSTVCADRSSLRSHWAQHKTAAKCKLCGDLVLWTSNMRTHAELHAYLWTCTLCKDVPAVYRSSKEYGYHYRTIHRRSECDYCGSRHKSKSALAHHISLRHLPPVCVACNKEFKDVHCLRRHTYSTHPALLDKAVDPSSTYCVECDRHFVSEFKYKLHLKTAIAHNPAAAYSRKSVVPCPDCDKVFTRKSYMNNHRRQVHTKETKHYCEQCDKYLVSAWSMKKHIEGVHQKIRQPKNKVCDLCGRAFQTNAVLIKHIRTHTGERPYKCAHCPAAFAQSSALKSHSRTQHKLL